MDIYKWECPYCGYIHSEPSGTTETEAKLSKQQHIDWCSKPHTYIDKVAKPIDEYDKLREIWI